MIIKDFNRRIPTSTAFIIIIILAVLFGGFTYGQYSKMRSEEAGLIKVKLPEKVSFPIDTKEEAVVFARRDSEVKSFIKEWAAKGSKIRFWADFDEEDSLWTIGVHPDSETESIWFEISFESDGTIMEKGQVKGV
jgi:hypothetical protein